MIELVMELQRLERQLAELESRKTALRLELENRTRELGGTAQIAGVAQLYVMPPSQSHRYDAKALSSLIADMVATGDIDLIDWARKIAQARQTTERAGWLRVSWVDKR